MIANKYHGCAEYGDVLVTVWSQKKMMRKDDWKFGRGFLLSLYVLFMTSSVVSDILKHKISIVRTPVSWQYMLVLRTRQIKRFSHESMPIYTP
jgi:hypothetical protein